MQKNNPEEVQLKNGFSAYEQYINRWHNGNVYGYLCSGACIIPDVDRFHTAASAMQMAQNPDLIRQSNTRTGNVRGE